jgi:choline kinase
MKVGVLAAGVGERLGMGEHAPPKALLRFNGETLLQRHLDILAHFGLFDLTLVVGHQVALIERELAALGAPLFMLFVLWQRRRLLAVRRT